MHYTSFSHDFLFTILTCAHRMRVHFCPQHRLLFHLGLYLFKFELQDIKHYLKSSFTCDLYTKTRITK